MSGTDKSLIVCNMDGVIANNRHRQGYVDRNTLMVRMFKNLNIEEALASGIKSREIYDTFLTEEQRNQFNIKIGKQYDRFYKACVSDPPIKSIIKLLKLYVDIGVTTHIHTGRSVMVHEETVKWLALHNVPYAHLVMRDDGDFTQEQVLKIKWIKRMYNPATVLFVIDDVQKNVEAYHRAGYDVFSPHLHLQKKKLKTGLDRPGRKKNSEEHQEK